MSAATSFLAGVLFTVAIFLVGYVRNRRPTAPHLDAEDSMAFADECERIATGAYTPLQLREVRSCWRQRYSRQHAE